MNADTAEIREGLSNHETRLLYLENLHTLPDCREEPKTSQMDEVIQQWRGTISRREFDEMRGMVLFLQKKIYEHTDTARKKRADKEYRINI